MRRNIPGVPVTSFQLVSVGPNRRQPPRPPQKSRRPERSFLSEALRTPAPWRISTILNHEANRPNAAIEWAVGFGLGAGQGGMLVLPFTMAFAQSDMQFLGLSLFGMLLTGMAGVGLSVGLQASRPAQPLQQG